MTTHYHVWIGRESSSTGEVRMIAKRSKAYVMRYYANREAARSGEVWTEVKECRDPCCPSN